jgi:hypothetical protein
MVVVMTIVVHAELKSVVIVVLCNLISASMTDMKQDETYNVVMVVIFPEDDAAYIELAHVDRSSGVMGLAEVIV